MRRTRGARWGTALVGTLLAASSAGCSLGYLGHVTWGQAQILWARQPVDDVLADPALSPEARAKLELVEEARRYAESIGLTPGGSYRSFVQLDREWASLALSAARKDSLTPHLFHFPVVGALPYEGFFDEARAREAERELAAAGLDTYLRPVDAFSTLGWFDDPILSPMLRRPAMSLVDTILHESTHATVYWSHDVDLSESLATFVGSEGARGFAVEHFGADSPEVAELDARARERVALVAVLTEMFSDLDAYYGDPATTSEEKVAGRAARFEPWKARIREAAAMDGAAYGWLADREWNNAFLLSLRRYLLDVSDIARLHAELGGELSSTVAFFVALADDPAPRARLAERLDAAGTARSETRI